MQTIWRPPPHIRAIAIGIIRRGAALLVVEVRDDAGDLVGWRPLGGAIEFGERAAEALRRELLEELGETVAEPRLVTVIESHFLHHGARGHEIVFVLETEFTGPAAYGRESFQFADGGAANVARWVELATLRATPARLFPVGLADVI